MPSITIDEITTRSLISKSLNKLSKSEFLFDDNLLLAENKNVFSDSFQKFLYLDVDDYHRNIILPIIAKELIRFENISAGSANIGLSLVRAILSRYIKQSRNFKFREIKVEINDRSKFWIDVIKRNSFRSTSSDLDRFINQEISSQETIEIIKESLRLASLNSSIDVKMSDLRETKIDLKKGYRFKIKNDKNFLLGRKKISKSNVNCYVIDGMVESISEIHHLLSRAAENKEPYVVFLRNLDPEVYNTIYVNLQRGTIDLIPVCVGFEEDTINILNDISICTGCDLISSLNGDLISSSVRRDAVKIEKIEISENEIVIHNSTTAKSVKSHVKYLKQKKKLLKEADSKIRDLLNIRIKSQTSEKLQIDIGLDLIRREPGVMSQIDSFYRSFYPIINFGFFNFKDSNLTHHADTPFDQEIFNFFKSKDNLYPASSLCYGVISASSIILSLLSIGSSVIEDV